MSTTTAQPTLLTTGDIAKRLNRSPYQIRYVLESRRIQPIARAALFRLFPESVIPEVEVALGEIDERAARKAAAQ